jgi:hypothetical protein
MATPWQHSYDVTLRLRWKSEKDYDSHIAKRQAAEARKMRVKPVWNGMVIFLRSGLFR